MYKFQIGPKTNRKRERFPAFLSFSLPTSNFLQTKLGYQVLLSMLRRLAWVIVVVSGFVVRSLTSLFRQRS